jgi:hypothetical protein
VYLRARDDKGNLIIVPKHTAPPDDPKQEWFDQRRQMLGMPEWRIQTVWDEYERITMNGNSAGSA